MTSLFARARRVPAVASVLLLPVLVLARPTPSLAQSVTPGDLVGWWALQDEGEATYAFSADSTVRYLKVETSVGPSTGTGRWHLAGDTLVLGTMTVEVDGQTLTSPMDPRLVARDGQRLTMTRLHDQGTWKVRVLERVDSLPPASPR